MRLLQIVTFLALVFGFSCVPYALMIHTHRRRWRFRGAPGHVVPRFCRVRHLRTLPHRPRDSGLELAAGEVRCVCVSSAAALRFSRLPGVPGRGKGSFAPGIFQNDAAMSFGLQNHPRLAFYMLEIPLLATLGVIASLANALGEEIGWRGFLLSRLTGQFGFTVGCLISGCVWAVWHYPGLLWADYNSGIDQRYALACFSLMVISMSFVMGWLKLKSGSLWPCAMLHASHNLFIQGHLRP